MEWSNESLYLYSLTASADDYPREIYRFLINKNRFTIVPRQFVCFFFKKIFAFYLLAKFLNVNFESCRV